MPEMRTSLWGRQLGISSTGGLISAFGSTGKQSTDFVTNFQVWGSGHIQSVSSAGAVMSNSGLTVVSSGSTSGTSFAVAAPVTGISKEIHFACSATALSLGTTSTAIWFGTTATVTAAGGSTVLNITGGATGVGGTLVLRGLSATLWMVASKTVGSSS